MHEALILRQLTGRCFGIDADIRSFEVLGYDLMLGVLRCGIERNHGAKSGGGSKERMTDP
ncbi:hypothetical protein [Cupriavidus pauculus]|uniref:hypothetical protein n=1 Tax=Cupriavidus pauculus TaxID=82633 RepID=UPI001EE32719|nr:hypothetical protein [Cupriavidus pauculus]GJG98545.1 hypothetical protein CBA19C6_28670 [Cupriavidus pauculus]